MSKLLHSDQQLLHDFAPLLESMFLGESIYQVGSSVRGESYRDIDLRVMLEPEAIEKLKSVVDIDRLNMAVSIWAQKVTGLPIDFQVQNEEYANKHHNGVRSAVSNGGVAKGDGGI